VSRQRSTFLTTGLILSDPKSVNLTVAAFYVNAEKNLKHRNFLSSRVVKMFLIRIHSIAVVY